MSYQSMATEIQKALKKYGEDIDLSWMNEMAGQIDKWDRMYRNKADWLDDNVKSCELPASIAGEIARLVTLEMKSEITGSPRAEYLNGYYQQLLKDIRIKVEYACARGGLVFKPYATENGLVIQCVQANKFFPIAFDDEGKITDGIFVEEFTRNKKVYTRLERHTILRRMIQGKLTSKLLVRNYAFVSNIKTKTLGSPINLKDVDRWQDLEEAVEFVNIFKLPFGYMRIPLANTIDPDSPLGVSVYSRAVGSIKSADIRHSQIDWEYEAKEAAVHVSEQMLKYNKDTNKFTYPGGKKRLYRQLEYNVGASDKPLLDVYSPDIRDASLHSGYDKQLKLVEFNCNLAYGTLSDPNNVDKTAEEIRSSKQRSYSMVASVQQALQSALEDLIDAMNYWCGQYELCQDGDVHSSFNWDDSVVVDKEKDRQTDRTDVAMGAMKLWEYRMKWYGEDEEEAKAVLSDEEVEEETDPKEEDETE